MEEKKGNIFTQMAVMSDLFEKVNMESEDTSVIFMVSEDEFGRLFDIITKKANVQLNKVDDTFSVKIGEVEYVFSLNKSNV